MRGRAMTSEVLTGRLMASDFGASSPNTICKNVIKKNATGTAIACAASGANENHIPCTAPRIKWLNASSPTHHKPSDASVIPSWHAERYASRCSVIFFAIVACLLPASC